MAERRTPWQNLASEQKRQQTARTKLAHQFNDAINPVATAVNQQFRNSFMEILALLILDGLEAKLVELKTQLLKNNDVVLTGPFEVVSNHKLNCIIQIHQHFVRSSDDITVLTGNFDAWLQGELDKQAEAGKIPPAQLKFTMETPGDDGSTWIEIASLEFTPR